MSMILCSHFSLVGCSLLLATGQVTLFVAGLLNCMFPETIEWFYMTLGTSELTLWVQELEVVNKNSEL